MRTTQFVDNRLKTRAEEVCCQCHAANTPTVASISFYIRSRAQPQLPVLDDRRFSSLPHVVRPEILAGIEACGRRGIVRGVNSGVEKLGVTVYGMVGRSALLGVSPSNKR